MHICIYATMMCSLIRTILNIKLTICCLGPKGDQGDRGATGQKGMQGEVGPEGPRGQRGMKGV